MKKQTHLESLKVLHLVIYKKQI